MPMRWLNGLLLVLLLIVQGQLWLGDSGLGRLVQLGQELGHQEAQNEQARDRNARLLAEVRDLREGLEMVEEQARVELGMVKPDELVVQFSTRPPPAAGPPLLSPGTAAAPSAGSSVARD